jgi:NTE family protein
LQFDAKGVATNFVEQVAAPLQAFCSRGIDVAAGLEGLLSFSQTISDRVCAKYREGLFGDATLQDLPDTPVFLFYATSLQTGSSFRFTKQYLADYRLGCLNNPKVPLATAVAASSAFPPVLSPVVLATAAADWQPLDGADLYPQQSLREHLVLTDGGVYDNLGLEAIWDRCGTVLVSDAGAPLGLVESPSTAWADQSLRVFDIVTNQTRALRKRRLIQDYEDQVRKGTYWGIRTRIGDYGLPDSITKDSSLTGTLSAIRTRLDTFTPQEQGHLINWGYALTDAAMRCHVIAGASGPQWPVPEFPL